MNYAVQRCCTTPVFLKQYESSTDAVLKSLGVELTDIQGFGCCGYPLKNFNYKAYILSSAKNLALAEKSKLDILTFCNCCYGSLKHAAYHLERDGAVKDDINVKLKKEGLAFTGAAQIRHLLGILFKDVGIERIQERIVKSFEGLKVATHYGCHLLRPRQIVQFDNPLSPSIFDQLVKVTGAESIPWPRKLDCCGSPMWGIHDELSMDLAEKKIMSAMKSGADLLCVACPYCQLQFDRVQKMHLTKGNGHRVLPSILYTQLLGLSLGIDSKTLGIHQNELDPNGATAFIEGLDPYEAREVSFSKTAP